MTPKLQVSTPCTANWEQMAGDDRVRYCDQCNLHVHNLSALTEREVKRLIREHEGQRLCGRLFLRPDGTVITRDCQSRIRPAIANASRLAIAALSAVLSTGTGTAQTPHPPLIQVAEAKGAIALKVTDPTGATMPGASISLSSENLVRPVSGTANQNGEWQFAGLTPGRYKLQVTSTGFQADSRSVTISGHHTLQVDITMRVGVVGQVVQVEVPPHQSPVKKVMKFFEKF